MKRLVAEFLVAVMLVVGCQPQGGGPQEGTRELGHAGVKRITVATVESLATVNQDDNLTPLFMAGLVNFDSEGEPTAQLAEQAPTIENGLWKLLPDGQMETTLTIRPNVRWHDGTPLTTADLVFGAAVAQQYPQGNFGTAAFANIETMEPRDARTIVVSWKRPYVQANWLFSDLFAQPLPRHLLEESFRELDNAAFLNLRFWTSEFVGNGPFVVDDFAPGTYLRLKAFDLYVPGRPKLDEIEIRFITNANTLMANLLAGEIDLTLGPGLSIEQSLKAREAWPEGEVIYSSNYETQAVGYPQFVNPSPPILANVQFRRALAHAIDRDEIVQSIQAGVGAAASALVAPTGSEFEAVKHAIADYPYDPRRAGQIIEGLGFSKGADGLFRDSTGLELAVHAWTGAESDTYVRTTLAVVDYWRRVGVAAEPRTIPATSDRSVMPSRPGFQMAALRTHVDTRFLSSETPLAENNFRGSNRARYMNRDLDALIDRYFSTVPRPERLGVLADVVRHLSENVVVIHLFYNAVPQMKSQRLKNVPARTVRARAPDSHLWDLS